MDNSRDQTADEAFEALFQIFSDPKLKSYAHFRCPLDGPPSGLDKVFDDEITKHFGLNAEYERWVERLR